MCNCLTGVLKTQSLYMSDMSQTPPQYVTDAILAALTFELFYAGMSYGMSSGPVK